MSADLSEAFGSELVALGAEDDAALAEAARRLALFLEQAPNADLGDVAHTCAKLYDPGSAARLAIVAGGTADLRGRLKTAAERIAGGAARVRDKSGTYYFRKHLIGEGAGKLAFVFPGASSFYHDMLRELAVRFRECRVAFDELETALKKHSRFSPADFIFPPAEHYRRDADVFSGGGYSEAMVATYCANSALARVFAWLGIEPDGVTGFSGGDLNALAAAGALGKFERKDRLKFLEETYAIVNKAVESAGLPKCEMVAVVTAHAEQMAAVLEKCAPEAALPAFLQSPRQVTLAVAPEAAEGLMAELPKLGARGMRLAVDRPFNTKWSEKIVPAFRKFAGKWVDGKPRIPVYSCATAEPLPAKARKIREAAAEQWATPVRFEETVRRMHEDGFRVFVEAGPRGMATTAIEEILKGREFAAFAPDSPHRDGVQQLQHTLAALAALGARLNPAALFENRRCRMLDFDSPQTVDARADSEMRLSRTFPVLSAGGWGEDATTMASAAASVPGERNKKGMRRAAAERLRRQRQRMEHGAKFPLVADGRVAGEEPGVSIELEKTLALDAERFFSDYARGLSRMSYSDPSLRGYTPLTLMAGAEIMAETAQMLLPAHRVVAVHDLICRRTLAFREGRLALRVRAERMPASAAEPGMLVKVQLREAEPGAEHTWAPMEATCRLAEEPVEAGPFVPPVLAKPRDVNWRHCGIYPERLCAGASLRCITAADRWSETGLDYVVEAPEDDGAIRDVKVPVWALNPLVTSAVADGFALWRSHERFPGAFSFAFSLRRLEVHSALPPPGTKLHCYLRNTGVTPKSLVTDIMVSDGNGKLVMAFYGYEELTERVPDEYRRLILSPADTYLTKEPDRECFGNPDAMMSAAAITDVPYGLFERNEETWLKTMSQIVLDKHERREFESMPGAASRRTEWLFGRIAAKEAVRRFLKAYKQSNWCCSDVQIYRDDSGKPHPIGKWNDVFGSSQIDLAIAHTAQFVVALVALNSRVGVDVEARGRELSEEFLRGVFTHDEQELAAQATDASSAALRFWCAKEAVSKALGTGIRYSPRELVVAGYDAAAGVMEVELTGQWLANFKMFTGRKVKVSSCIVKGHVLASCFIPESLFEG